MHPAVRLQGCSSILLVLVVALHNHLALDHNLAWNALWVIRLNLHIEELFEVLTTRAEFVLLRLWCNADKRSALGHTVTHDNREVDRLQERLGLLIHRSATHNKHLQVATKRSEQLLLNLQAHNLIYQRYLHSDTQRSLFEHWGNLLAIDLLQYERYRADNRRLHLLHSLDQDLRSRHLAEEVDMTTRSKWREEVECATKGVCQRQECQGTATLLEPVFAGSLINLIYSVIDIGGKVIYGKHYALRVARSTRCVTQHHKGIIRNIGILDILYGKAVRITLAIVLSHGIYELGKFVTLALVQCVVVGNREYTLHLRHSVFVKTVPIRIGEEQKTATRVVYDMCDIVRGKGLHNRHNNCAVCNCSDIYGTPTRCIATYEGNFVALLDSSLIKEDMQLGYLLGKSIVRVSFTRKVICYSRHLAIITK